MRKYLKRLILFTMVLSLLIQTTQIPAIASTVGDSQNHSLESEATNYEMVATNDFGAMLKNSIQEEQETESDYNIFDIVVTGNIATVTYCAAENSMIVAAIYDESGKMLASGKGTADADEESVDITIDIDTMPEYFLVSAYMLDEQSNNPRCESFTSQYYTEAFQDFLSKTIYDFDEDRVLNLDDDITTNFAVYHDTTTLIRPTSGTNTIIFIDEENRIYTIGNIDESIKSLKTGDIFVYSYDEENTIIVKVADINIEGTTATIVGQEVSLEEVFSYVKIDAESDDSNFEVDNSNLEDGLTYVGSGEVEPLLRAIEIDKSKSIKLNYDYVDNSKKDTESSGEDKDNNDKINFDGSFKVSFGFSFEIKAKLQFYVSWNYKYFKLSLTNKLSVTGTISAKVRIEKKLKLGELNIPLCTGINIGLTPAVVFEGSVEAGFSVSAEAGYEVGVSSDEKFKLKTKKTKYEYAGKVEGKIFIGVDCMPDVNIGISGLKAAKVGMDIRGGVEIIASVKIDLFDMEKHDCLICLDGEIYLKSSIGVEFKVLKWKNNTKLDEKKAKLADFYYSVDHLKGGLGTCPYISYKVDVSVKNNEGNALENVQIEVAPIDGTKWKQPEEWKTNKDGKFSMYLPNGKYRITYTYGGQTEQKEITIKDNSRIYPPIIMSDQGTGGNNPGDTKPGETEKPGENIDPEATSGICGDNLKWKIEGNVLTIYGSGDMYNYSDYNNEDNNHAPWIFSTKPISEIVIEEGVTSIGDAAFEYFGALYGQKIDLIIPEGVTRIGEYSFWGALGIQNVTFPNSVEIIESGAFFGTSIETVKIPEKVHKIAASTFGMCEHLATVQMHDEIEEIGDGAFWQCTQLKKITIPESVKIIGEGAFAASGLVEIKLPRQLKKIEVRTFGSCFDLENIELPKSIEKVEKEAFVLCKKLNNVIIRNPYCLISIGRAFPSTTTIYAYTGYTQLVGNYYTIDDYINSWKNPFVSLGSVSELYQDNAVADIVLYANSPAVNATVSSGSALTKAYTNLPGNTEFLFVASKSDSEEDILESENLLYIGQSASDGQGNVSFQYILKEDDTRVYYYLFGYRSDAMKIELQDGDIVVSDLTYNGMEQFPSIVVTHNGVVLREGEDYILGGSTSGILAGTYYFTVSGINYYTGTINGSFTITESSSGGGWSSGASSGFWDTWVVDSQRAENAKKELEIYFAQYEFRNGMSKADIEQTIAEVLVRLGYQDVKAELGNDYTQTDATEQEEGKVSGTLTITCGAATKTLELNFIISKLPEEVQEKPDLTANEIVKLKGLDLLLVKANPKSKKSVSLKWKNVENADGYEIYWTYCGSPKNYTLLKQTEKLSATQSKMDSKKNYLYYVLAYKVIDGKKVYTAKSPAIHVTMPGNKRTNVKSITVPKTKLALNIEQRYQIEPTAVVEEKGKKALRHVSEYRYFSTDPDIVKVNRTTGKAVAKKKGSCYIYVVANNGVYKRIKITVK